MLAVAAAARAHGAGAAAVPDAESPWKIGLAFGYGERSNPLVQSEDIDILVDVDIAWFGKRWFFDNGDVGRTLLDGERLTLNAVARFNSDRVFFSKTDTEYVSLFGFAGTLPPERIVVPDRDYAFEAGVELLADGVWGFVQAAAHGDVSGTHDGYELYANYGRTMRRERWFFEPSVGASWKSADLNDYYWGVRPEESSLALPEYRVGAGWNTHARLATSYQLTRHWTFVVAAQYERLSAEAARSPLVEERSVKSGFAGFNYRF
jgi:outer membrane protein